MNLPTKARGHTIADGIDGLRNISVDDIPKLLTACGATLPDEPILVEDVSHPEPWPVIATDRAEFLAKRLNACAAWYFSLNKAIASRAPAPSRAATDYRNIAKATARLWKSLKLKPDQTAQDMPDHPLHGLRRSAARYLKLPTTELTPIDRLNDAVNSIKFLHWIAEDAQDIQKRRKADTKDRNSGDEPRRILLNHLMNTWFEAFNEVPRSVYDAAKDKPTSPFLKFCILIFQRLGVAGTPEAIHKQVGRIRKEPPWGLRWDKSDQKK